MGDYGRLCILCIVDVFRDYNHAWLRVIARESHGAEHIRSIGPHTTAGWMDMG